jgi:hypothetical protein
MSKAFVMIDEHRENRKEKYIVAPRLTISRVRLSVISIASRVSQEYA